MAGHSRWAQVKHHKAGSDARRSALFSKLSRLIMVAAGESRPDGAPNAKLRQAIEQARGAGMPKENIGRAIARARGAVGSQNVTAREYEAYGPGGVAILISVLTDNLNRTTAEVRRLLTDCGGKLAAGGSVAWMFLRRAIVEFDSGDDAEARELALIDSGAADTATDGERVRAIVDPERLGVFLQAAARRGLSPVASEHRLIAIQTVALDAASSQALGELKRALEDHPDVTAVATNAEDGPPSP